MSKPWEYQFSSRMVEDLVAESANIQSCLVDNANTTVILLNGSLDSNVYLAPREKLCTVSLRAMTKHGCYFISTSAQSAAPGGRYTRQCLLSSVTGIVAVIQAQAV